MNVRSGVKAQRDVMRSKSTLQQLHATAYVPTGIRIDSRQDMRRTRYNRNAVGDERSSHLDGSGQVVRAVIYAREQVAMNVDHG